MRSSVVEQSVTDQRPGPTNDRPSNAGDLPEFDQLARQTAWLQAVFETLELLDCSLDKLGAWHATLPSDPGLDKLQAERSRLSCELFQVRMTAVKASGLLGQLR